MGFWSSILKPAKKFAKWISPIVHKAVNVVKEVVSQVVEKVTPYVTPIINAVNDYVIQPIVNHVVKPIANAVNNYVIQPIVNAVKRTWAEIKPYAQAAWNKLKNIAQDSWDRVKSFANSVWEDVKSAAKYVWDKIKTLANAAWNVVEFALSAVWTVIGPLVNAVWNVLSPILTSVWDLIRPFANAVFNGIKDFFQGAWNFLKEMYSNYLFPIIYGVCVALVFIPAVIYYIIKSFFINEDDDDSSDEEKAQKLAKKLYDEGMDAFAKGEISKAKALFEQAEKVSQDEDFRRKCRKAMNDMEESVQNKKAETLNTEGCDEYNRQNYKAARDKFAEAHRKCSENYKNRNLFMKNLNKAEAQILGIEGKSLMDDQKFHEAIQKFRQALDLFAYNDYRNQIAECYFALGNKSADEKNLKKAQEFYQKACNECTNNYANKAKFNENLQNIKIDISNADAEKLNSEGCDEYNNKQNYKAARDKFAEAYRKCSQNYKNRNTFMKNLNQAEAQILSIEGKSFMNDQKFHEAIQKFRQALDLFAYNDYRNQIAECYFALGNESSTAQNFNEAHEFYKKACENCTKGYANEETFKNSLNKAGKDIKNAEARKINREGLDKLYAKNFHEAFAKFSQACNHCSSDSPSKTIYRDNRNHALASIHNFDAKKLHDRENYEDAVKLHKKALEVIPKSKHWDVKIFKNDLANTYNEIGVNYQKNKKLSEAKNYFEMAIGESSHDNPKLREFKENLAKSNDGIKNQNAETLYEEGLAAFRLSDYTRAEVKFNEACCSCASDYKNKDLFDNYLKRSIAAIFHQNALSLLQDGDVEEAIEEFKKAIKALPEMFRGDFDKFHNCLSEAYYQVGLAAWRSDDFSKAQNYFNMASESCTESYESKKLYEVGMRHATAAITNAEGNKFLAENKNREAINKFKDALSKLRKEKSEVLQTSNFELKFRKNLTNAYNQLGLELLKNRGYENAKFNFKLAINEAMNFNDPKLIEELKINLKKAEDEILNQELEFITQDGLHELKNGNFDAALRIFTRALEKIGESHLKRENLIENQKFAEAAILHRDGVMHLTKNEVSSAIEKLEKALEILPTNQLKKIETYNRDLTKAYTKKAEILFKESQNHIEKDELEKALEKNDQAFKIAPSEELKAQKATIIEKALEKDIKNKNFNSASEKLTFIRNLKPEKLQIFDEKDAEISLRKLLTSINKLNPTPAVKRILRALEKFKNFDLIPHDLQIDTLKAFYERGAFDQAKKFIEKITDKNRKKELEKVPKFCNLQDVRSNQRNFIEQEVRNERILIA